MKPPTLMTTLGGRLRAPLLSPTRACLRAGEVDIWRARLDEQPADLVQIAQAAISADEAERAQGFYFERDRRRFIIGRGILRLILARYLNRNPRALIFRYNANDKPELIPDQAGEPPLHFNVAHSEGLALFAFTCVGEVGIDVERVRDIPEWEQIAASCFSPRELARMYSCPEEQRPLEFFRAWTRQEAVLKALGTGLGGAVARPRGSSGVLPGEARGSAGLQAEPESPFSVYPLNPAAGFVAALAIGEGGRWTTCHTWQPKSPRSLTAFPRRGRRIRLENIPETGADFL